MPPDAHRIATIVLSGSLIVLGAAIIVRTLDAGGGALSMGILLGVLFVLAGAARLWLARRGS